MGHLTASEHDRHLHLVAPVEELGHLAGLGVEVATADLGPVLHLLDGDVGRLAAGLLVPLGVLVLPLAVVQDLAHRRIGHGGNLDEVEIGLPGDVKRFGEGLDAQLPTLRIDQTHLARPDAIVDPNLVVNRCGYAASLLEREASGRRKATSALLAVDRPGRTTACGRVGARPAFLFCFLLG